MDNYPELLAPMGNDTFEKEPFRAWWNRVSPDFLGVPRNVAHHWLWRHWDHSPFGWLPRAGASFELVHFSPEDVEEVKIWNEGDCKYADWGDYLLSLSGWPKGSRYRVSEIMARRKRWPSPPIVLDNRVPIAFSPWDDLPTGFVLVEGNRRMAMAKALARKNELANNLPVWMLSY